ncbi:MAG: hypothetical protein ABIH69_04720, partial [bacterium]
MTLLLFGTTPALAVDGTSLDPSNNLYAARQLGLGGLSIGFADDANGVFANPAGLTDFEFPQISGSSRTLLLGEVQSTLLTWAMPTEQGTFGVGFTSLNTGGSYPTKLDPATSRIIIDPSREATSYDNSVLAISYSRKLRDSLAIGGNLKFFNQALSGDTSSKASATGVDLALLYAPNPIWSFGANLQNVLEGNLKWEGGAADKIGGFYKIGAKVNILGPAEEALREHEQELAAGFDYNLAHNTTASSNYQFGLEYFPLKKIALRSGLGPKGLSFGVGLTNGGFRFDYAYSQDPNIPGDAPHYFTLAYVGERVKKIHYQLKHYKSLAKFIYPPDRTITDEPMIAISAEAMVGEVFEEKQIWEVTGLAATEESKEIVRAKNASTVYLNGDKLNQTGSIKTSIQLGWQRNVLQLISYSSFEGEMIVASAETRVLRYKPFADVLSSHWALRP